MTLIIKRPSIKYKQKPVVVLSYFLRTTVFRPLPAAAPSADRLVSRRCCVATNTATIDDCRSLLVFRRRMEGCKRPRDRRSSSSRRTERR